MEFKGKAVVVWRLGDWIKKPGVAIVSCNDGLRPVYFKLEATDEQAGPFLGRD